MRVHPVSRCPFDEHALIMDRFLEDRLRRVDDALKQERERLRCMDDGIGPQVTPREQNVSPYLTESPPSSFARMLCMLATKPTHLPIFSAMCLLLLMHSDARVPKKPHPIADKVRILHQNKPESHGPEATVSKADVFALSKRISREAWHHNSTVVSEKFREDFNAMNQATHGDMGNTLTGVFEIRLLDLQHAVRHAKTMVDIMRQIAGDTDSTGAGCPACFADS